MSSAFMVFGGGTMTGDGYGRMLSQSGSGGNSAICYLMNIADSDSLWGFGLGGGGGAGAGTGTGAGSLKSYLLEQQHHSCGAVTSPPVTNNSISHRVHPANCLTLTLELRLFMLDAHPHSTKSISSELLIV